MNRMPSPFYPPRARWYSRWFYVGYALRRWFHVEEVHRVLGCSVAQFLAVVLVPGYGFRAAGRGGVGPALAAYAFLALVFLIWLGHGIADLAFGLMLALHACGTTLSLSRIHGLDFRHQLGAGLGIVLLLGVFVYWPGRDSVIGRWVIPLRTTEQVILVHRLHDPRTVGRGDWIAFRIDQVWVDGHSYIAAGYGLEQVLALPGQRVSFASGRVLIDGQAQPGQESMPATGEWVVPEKHWFIWPSRVIHAKGLSEATVAAAWNQIVLVDQARLVGKPFKRWFWRQQTWP